MRGPPVGNIMPHSPRRRFSGAEQRVENAHIGERVFKRKFERSAAHCGAEFLGLIDIHIERLEGLVFLHGIVPDAAVAADQNLRFSVGRLGEGIG